MFVNRKTENFNKKMFVFLQNFVLLHLYRFFSIESRVYKNKKLLNYGKIK